MGGKTDVSTPSASIGTYVSSDMHILVLVPGVVYLQLYFHAVAVLVLEKSTCTSPKRWPKTYSKFLHQCSLHHFKHETAIKNEHRKFSMFDLQKSALISTLCSSA